MEKLPKVIVRCIWQFLTLEELIKLRLIDKKSKDGIDQLNLINEKEEKAPISFWLNGISKEKLTAYMKRAIESNNKIWVKNLMTQGISSIPFTMGEKTLYHMSLIHYAIKKNKAVIVELLAQNSNIDLKQKSPCFPYYGLLHLCAEHNALDCAKILLKYNKNLIDDQDNDNKDTPLHHCVKYLNEDGYLFAQWLLEQGAKRDTSNKKGQTVYQCMLEHQANNPPTQLVIILNSTPQKHQTNCITF